MRAIPCNRVAMRLSLRRNLPRITRSTPLLQKRDGAVELPELNAPVARMLPMERCRKQPPFRSSYMRRIILALGLLAALSLSALDGRAEEKVRTPLPVTL